MSADKRDDEREPVQRTGEEARLRKNLRDVDREVGRRPIRDDSYSESRREKRRGRFIDLHADEDSDPTRGEHDVHGGSSADDSRKKPSRLARMVRKFRKRIR